LPCHGETGKGDGPKGADLKRKPGDLSHSKMGQQMDGELFWKITEGKTPMPSFETKLSEEERWEVVNYIRTLGPKSEGTTPARPDNGSPREEPSEKRQVCLQRGTRETQSRDGGSQTQIQEMLKKQGLPAPKRERSKSGERIAQPAEGGLGNPRLEFERPAGPSGPLRWALSGSWKRIYVRNACLAMDPAEKGMGRKAAELREMAADLTDPELFGTLKDTTGMRWPLS